MANLTTKKGKIKLPQSIVNNAQPKAISLTEETAEGVITERPQIVDPNEGNDIVEEMQKSIDDFVKPIEKSKTPPVKMWVVQKPVTVDLHPSVSANIAELDAEIETYRKAIEQNQYARKRAISGVLKAFEITPRDANLNGISFIKTSDDIYQLIVPQSDKLIER